MFLRAFAVLGCILSAMILVADDATFISLYDSGKHVEAAKALEHADLKNHEVARRAGAMYYRGLGVEQDKERGKAYIEAAMSAGDAKAAINLAKIWYRSEHNPAKAAWCLLVAENANDESIQTDVAKLHERFGSDYKTGLEQYIRQQDAAMKKQDVAMRKMTADYNSEEASFHQQLLEANQAQEKLRDQIRALEGQILENDQAQKKLRGQIRALDEQLLAAGQTQKKLRDQIRAFEEKVENDMKKAEKARKELEEKYRLAEKRISDLIGTTNEQQRVILALEDQRSEAKSSLEKAHTKWSDLENELSSATIRLSELDKEHGKLEELQKEYAELQREHAELQGLYRDLVNAYSQPNGKGNSGGDRSWFKGIGRGFATLVMAPCNYLRVVPQTCEMADEIDSKNGCSQLSVIMAFPLLVWDTIPTIVDIADGVVDIVSLGAYGDWLYSEKGFRGNSPWWYERSSKGFPWIQK